MMANTTRTSRRRLLQATALAAPGFALRVTQTNAQEAAEDAPTPVSVRRRPSSGQRRALRERVTFVVVTVQDPYPGEVQQPPEPEPGTRYVAAEVIIDNGANQPLNFNPAEIRVRDTTGVEYRGGSAIGTEPWLGARNLNAGERSRGWIWFTVAANAELVDLLYVAPPPQFRVALPAGPDSD